ncbi:MAG: efflux RND transporter periplasmic adaptor subunit [Maribacter sp.]|nr:efflux RND transporter periplasmic adaptor subunit [Maribacter sp.]
MKTKLFTSLFAVMLFLFTSCGSDSKKGGLDTTTIIPVHVSTVIENNNSRFLTASGKLEAKNSADLSTRMMGFVNGIYAQVGDKVKKGQLLLSINNTDLQAKRAQVEASITEATAAFTNAKKDHDRFQNLFAENSASPKEMDDVTAHFEMAKARLEAANQMKNEINAQFSYANITAPFDGVITNKVIDLGDLANPGMPLLSMESPGNFQVIAMVPENEISKIRSGSDVTVLIKSLGTSVTGKVTEVSSSAKNTGGQYLVKAVLDKTDAKILSGMFATVQFPIAQQSKAVSMILIPQSALVENGSLKGVYTISDQNRALLRWLRLGKIYGDQVEVLSGLSSEEQYIVSADGKLFNGAKVSIQ